MKFESRTAGRWALRILGLLILGLGLVYLTIFEIPYLGKSRTVPVRFNQELLQQGDIVFRNGNSFMSERIVYLSPERVKLSHTGIIVREGDQLYVIHIVGDHFANYVRKEPLDDFISNGLPDHLCVTRYSASKEVRNEIAATALKYYQEKRGFDYDMTLESERDLFCTELVWRAILDTTGKDVSPQKIPWRGTILIGFKPFFRSPNFEPVYLEKNCPVFETSAASLP